MYARLIFLVALIIALCAPVNAQIPIEPDRTPRPTPRPTARPTPRPTARPTPQSTPRPTATPRVTVRTNQRTPRPSTEDEDFRTSWVIKLSERYPVKKDAGDERRPTRIQIDKPALAADEEQEPPPSAEIPQPRILEAPIANPARVIVGRVGDREMTLAELQRRVELAMRGKQFAGPTEEVELKRGKMERAYARRILGDWIDTSLLLADAERRGIRASEKDIQEYVQTTAEDRGLAVPLEQRAMALGISVDELREILTEAVLADKVIRTEIMERITEKELREKYETMPGMFVAPPARHVIQIIAPFSETVTLEERNKLAREMEKIHRRLRWFGAKFETAAEPTNGIFFQDLGWLELNEPTTTDRQFLYYTVFATKQVKPGQAPEYVLKCNEISDVGQSIYGIHILKVIEERPMRQRSFEEARHQVEDRFFATVRKLYLEELRVRYQPRYSITGLQDLKPASALKPPSVSGRGLSNDVLSTRTVTPRRTPISVDNRASDGRGRLRTNTRP